MLIQTDESRYFDTKTGITYSFRATTEGKSYCLIIIPNKEYPITVQGIYIENVRKFIESKLNKQ